MNKSNVYLEEEKNSIMKSDGEKKVKHLICKRKKHTQFVLIIC